MTKEIDKKLITGILDSPQAPILLEEIRIALVKEKEKRLHFYNDITEQEKAEFINGEIIIHSPVMKRHNEVTGHLHQLINTFVYKNNLGFVGFEKILVQLTRNDYEPDICFFHLKASKNFKADQTIFPAPNLVIEILSKGTQKRDRGIKYEDYEAHGIKEYWIVDAKNKTIEQYLLKNGEYFLNIKSNTGEIQSTVIQGFKIPIIAIFDKKANFEMLKKILVN